VEWGGTACAGSGNSILSAAIQLTSDRFRGPKDLLVSRILKIY